MPTGSQSADTASSATSSNILAGLPPSPASTSSARASRDPCRWPTVLMPSKPTSPASDARRPRSAPASCAPRRNSPTPVLSLSIGTMSSGWPPGGFSAMRSTRLPARTSARKSTRPPRRRSTRSAIRCRAKAARRAALSLPDGLVCNGNRCCAMRTAAAIRIASIRNNAGAQTHPRRAETPRVVGITNRSSLKCRRICDRSLRQPSPPNQPVCYLRSSVHFEIDFSKAVAHSAS